MCKQSSNDQLEQDLYYEEQQPVRRSSSINQYPILVAGAAFLILATAAITLLIAKKTMKSSGSATPADSSSICDNNATGMVIVSEGNITFPSNTSEWISVPLTAVANFTCKQLLCNASALINLMNMTATFIRTVCRNTPELVSQNATQAQCNGYFNDATSAMMTSACRNNLTGVGLFHFRYDDSGDMNRTDLDKTTVSELKVSVV